MFSLLLETLVATLAGALLCAASPTPAIDIPILPALDAVAVRDPLDIARSHHLEKRITTNFDLTHDWKNKVLFGGSWTDIGESDAESIGLEITCIDCWTRGNVVAKLAEDIFKPVLRLEFDGVQAYMNIGFTAHAGATYALNLFSTDDPLGLGLPGLSVGLVFHLDLVFSVDADIDLTGGFEVQMAEGSFLETDIFTGDIEDHLFDGIGTKSIPVQVKVGQATFKAALRLRLQLGVETEFDFLGVGAGAVVGVYANIVEFVAILDSTPTCALQTREWFNLNVGAYARLDMIVDFKTIGPVPTVSTTLLNSPTWTQCLLENSPMETPGQPTLPVDPKLAFVESGTEPAATTSTSLCSESWTTIHAVTLPPARASGRQNSTANASSPRKSVNRAAVSQSRSTTPVSLATNTPNASNSTEAKWITSTIFATKVYTITSCAAHVINCPTQWAEVIVLTKTIDAFTTVCPPSAKIPFPSSIQDPQVAMAAEKPAFSAVHVITEIIALVPCDTPIVGTFTPPADRHPMTADTTRYLEIALPSQTALSAQLGAVKAEFVDVAPPGANTTAPHAVKNPALNVGAASTLGATAVRAGAGCLGRQAGVTALFTVAGFWMVFF